MDVLGLGELELSGHVERRGPKAEGDRMRAWIQLVVSPLEQRVDSFPCDDWVVRRPVVLRHREEIDSETGVPRFRRPRERHVDVGPLLPRELDARRACRMRREVRAGENLEEILEKAPAEL